jgi:hypothetical protein
MAPLRDSLAAELRAEQYEEGFASLLMTGRDADLVRLAKATLRQQPDKMTDGAALLALGAALRRADLDGFVTLYVRVLQMKEPPAIAMDMAWQSLRPASGMLTLDQALLLGKSLRAGGSFSRDAEEVARMVRRLGGEKARRDWIESKMAATSDANQKKALDALLSPPR